MIRHCMIRMTTGLFAAALLAATSALPALAGTEPVQSLRGTDVATADQAPAEKAMVGKRPGTQEPLVRSFEQQPPLVPHAMTNFDEITPEANQCLECHGADVYQKKNAPKIGDSHFRDQRTGEVKADMSSARYQCTLCHVPQADAPALVENTFKPAAPPAPRPAKKP